MRLLRIALCCVALLCTGCQLRLDIDIHVDRNGGGTLAVAVAADDELLALAEDAGADPLDDLVAAGEQLRDDGWRVGDTTDEGRKVVLTRGFADAEEFEELTSQLAATLAADEVELLAPMTMTVTDDEVAVAGAASAQPRAAVRDYGVTRRQAVRLIDRNDAFAYEIAMTMPGEVLESDADAVEGAELRWQVAPGEQVSLSAVSTRPGPPLLRLVIAAVAGAIVLGLILWLVVRRQRSS